MSDSPEINWDNLFGDLKKSAEGALLKIEEEIERMVKDAFKVKVVTKTVDGEFVFTTEIEIDGDITNIVPFKDLEKLKEYHNSMAEKGFEIWKAYLDSLVSVLNAIITFLKIPTL